MCWRRKKRKSGYRGIRDKNPCFAQNLATFVVGFRISGDQVLIFPDNLIALSLSLVSWFSGHLNVAGPGVASRITIPYRYYKYRLWQDVKKELYNKGNLKWSKFPRKVKQ